jgi:carbohydrate-selective porin OprB
MTSSIAAAHAAGILILKAQQHHPSTANQRQLHGKCEKNLLKANFYAGFRPVTQVNPAQPAT